MGKFQIPVVQDLERRFRHAKKLPVVNGSDIGKTHSIRQFDVLVIFVNLPPSVVTKLPHEQSDDGTHDCDEAAWAKSEKLERRTRSL